MWKCISYLIHQSTYVHWWISVDGVCKTIILEHSRNTGGNRALVNYIVTIVHYASVSGAPEAYGSRRVCLFVSKWVSESFCEIAIRISPRALKIKAWNVQCKLNAVLSWNEIGEFWISSFVVKLWRDLLTSMAVASNPEFSEEQIPHDRLLINMTVQSVQQII